MTSADGRSPFGASFPKSLEVPKAPDGGLGVMGPFTVGGVPGTYAFQVVTLGEDSVQTSGEIHVERRWAPWLLRPRASR